MKVLNGIILSSLLLFFLLVPFSPLQSSEKEYEQYFKEFQKLYYSGHFVEAYLAAKNMLLVAGKTFGRDHLLTAAAWNNLGQSCTQMGLYKEAETFLKKAFQLNLHAKEKSISSMATVLNNLGELYRLQKKYDQAEPIYRQAIKLELKPLGASHPNVATSFNNLGLMYIEKGDYQKAEGAIRLAIDGYSKSLGRNHPLMGSALRNLARLHLKRKEYDKAILAYKLAASTFTKCHGKFHYNVGVTLRELARAYLKNKSLSEAEKMAEASVICLYRALDKHPETADSAVVCGMIQARMGRHREGITNFARALEIYIKTFGLGHKKTISTIEKLIGAHRAKGNKEKVDFYEKLLQRALQKKYKKN